MRRASRAIYVRRVADGRPIPVSSELLGTHLRPAWAPDGEHLAFLTRTPEGRGRIYLAPATGGSPRLLFEEPPGVELSGLSWSPDGRNLVFVRDRSIVTLDVESGHIASLAEAWAPHSLAWSPTGDRIAYVSENSEFVHGTNAAPSSIWVVSSNGGDPIRITEGDVSDQSPVWWPDGRHLLFVSNRDGVLDVYSVELGSDSQPLGDRARWTTGLGLLTFDLSADGSKLAYAKSSLDSDIWALPVPEGETVARLSEAKRVTSGIQSVESLSLSPDRRWIAFDSNRDGNQDVFRVGVDGGEPTKVTRHEADDFAPVWSPDGQEIAFYSFRSGNRDLFVTDREGRRTVQLTTTPGSEAFPHWSPKGDALAFQYNSSGGTGDAPSIFLVERAASGWGDPRQITPPDADIPRWSPDGQWIAYRGFHQLEIVSVETGETAVVVPELAMSGGPVWSPDSETLLFAATHDGIPGIWSVPRTGGEPSLVAEHDDGPLGRFWFDTDGEYIYFTGLESNEAAIWIAEIEGRP